MPDSVGQEENQSSSIKILCVKFYKTTSPDYETWISIRLISRFAIKTQAFHAKTIKLVFDIIFSYRFLSVYCTEQQYNLHWQAVTTTQTIIIIPNWV